LLLSKWDEDISNVMIPRRLKLDVSASYDGVDVVSPRFRELYERAGMSGLEFIPLTNDFWSVRALAVVVFDARRRGTRFENQCEACGQYESVIGSSPAYLVGGSEVPDMGFARTDLEFASEDEKSPVLICGDAAAEVLRDANLRGLELEPVGR
jgi:hypothetical protein